MNDLLPMAMALVTLSGILLGYRVAFVLAGSAALFILLGGAAIRLFQSDCQSYLRQRAVQLAAGGNPDVYLYGADTRTLRRG